MKLSKSLSVLLSLSLALFFLTAAIAFPILFRPFYYSQADALNLPEQLGLEESVIHEAYDEVMDYLVYGAPFGTGELRWSAEGQAHFADCRVLFRLDFLLLAISAILLVLLAVLYCRGIRFHHFLGRSPAFWSAAGLSAVFLAAAVWAILDFDGLFTAFHHIFFPGKTNWVFDWRTDEIILILPEAFWARTGALVLVLCLGGLWLTTLALWLIRRYRKS
ncbi:TIGR01906 family membrane protein [Agathobaculum sp.]|uniref:TIGR01906 family membrane protein n=1 Tax=Agathobaculum sp. TaxID=2048138 RepID=UPI0027BA4AF1|nr:TIGR01906 family membrane protein [Agathobaculum sp.]